MCAAPRLRLRQPPTDGQTLRRSHVAIVAFLAFGSAPALAAERGFTVTDFDRIRLEAPYQVTLETGRSSTARASGDREALDRVRLDVQGRTLVIRTDTRDWGGFPGRTSAAGPVMLRLSTQALRGVTLIGSGALSVNRLRGERFVGTLDGSATFAADGIAVDRFELVATGSSSARLAGTARMFGGVVRGSARVEGAQLLANDLTLTTQSSDRVALAARTSAKVQSSGSGETVITGKPACTVSAIGSGSVTCGR